MAISIDEAFENCLKISKEQGLSIQDCAARYPQYEKELVEILGLVTSLKVLDQLSPRTQFVENAKQRLVAKLPDRNVSYGERTRPIRRKRQLKLSWDFRFIRIAVVVVFVMLALTGGTAYAADYAEPGDFLYGLDLTLEQIQLNLASNPEVAAKIRLDIAAERLVEAENKFNEGDVNNGDIALDAYENEMAALAEMVDSVSGIEQEKLAELVSTARSRHQEVLIDLLSKVPEPAREGIRRAIDASSKSKKETPQGPPEDLPKGPPEDKTTGPSEDKGKPNDKIKGKPEKVKTPPGKP